MDELLEALDDVVTNDADLLRVAMEHSEESANMFGGEQAQATAQHCAEARQRLNTLVECWHKAGRGGEHVAQ